MPGLFDDEPEDETPADEETPDAEAEAKPDDTPDIKELAKSVEAAQSRHTAQEASIQALARSVGRLQSMLAKPDTSARDGLEQQYAVVSGLLAELVEGMDDESVPAGLKTKLRTVREQLQHTSTVKKVREDVVKSFADATPRQQDASPTLEESLVEEITSYNLDPDNAALFDWKKASRVLRTDGEAGVRKFIRGAIREAISASGADKRRQDRKVAGKAPVSAGPAGDLASKLDDQSASLDDRIKALRALGVSV